MRAFVTTTMLVGLLSSWSVAAERAAEKIHEVAGIRGGLAVHVGCGEGRLTAALRSADNWTVQGLDTDPEKVANAREHFRAIEAGGRVSAAVFDGRRLPYADNLVNLLVVSQPCSVDGDECRRVLCPGGVMVSVSEDGSKIVKQLVKPWPENIGHWTHYLHGPDNNAVGSDQVVGPPRHMQWTAGPQYSRSHDHLASVSAMVSSGGRLFSILDAGSIAFAAARPHWRLVARDAFSGVLLWEREIPTWEHHLRDFRAGPADIARRLVAIGDRVYVTLGYNQPISMLDAATGEAVRVYEATQEAQEFLVCDETLFVVLGTPDRSWPAARAREIVQQQDYEPPFEQTTPPAHQKHLLAIHTETGEVLWKNAQPYVHTLMPSTLAVSDGRAVFQNAEAIVCLDAATGEAQWQSPRPIQRRRLAWSTPTLVVHGGLVFSADRRAAETTGELLWIPSGGYHQYIQGDEVEGELIALDLETGERLWSCPAYEGFNSPVDVMIADGLLWTGRYAWGNDPGITVARDPKTGQVRRQRPADQELLPRMGHARCHRAKATDRYLILGRRGIELVDVATGDMTANFWVRGICQYGVMPANGLLYVPPHSCACNYSDLIKSGFMALAPERQASAVRLPDSPAPIRGPAYDAATAPAGAADPYDWPTYRGDPSRSGAVTADISPDLKVLWQTHLGRNLTSPVIAQGVLLVADTDAHQVHALDSTDGQRKWTWRGQARVDSSPTVDGKRVLFGSADGWVVCLRLDDGALVWKFQAAPSDRQIVVDDQLESVWPVPGNVLVVDGSAYFVAGRNSYLDGGMFLYRLNAATGQLQKVVHLEVDQAKSDAGIATGGHLPDILSSDGNSLFLRSARFDLDLVRQKDVVPHLFSSVGFLDDSWWHRSYWQIGTSMGSGWGGWSRAGQQVPAGRLLVTDGTRAFGFGRNQYDNPGAHVGIDAAGVWGPIGQGLGRWTFYRLFARTLSQETAKQARRAQPSEALDAPEWTQTTAILAQAMVLANQTLMLAGPVASVDSVPQNPAEIDPWADALQSQRGGRLLMVDTADGSTRNEIDLPSPPIFDGMAVAQERVYLATRAGEIVCLGAIP